MKTIYHKLTGYRLVNLLKNGEKLVRGKNIINIDESVSSLCVKTSFGTEYVINLSVVPPGINESDYIDVELAMMVTRDHVHPKNEMKFLRESFMKCDRLDLGGAKIIENMIRLESKALEEAKRGGLKHKGLCCYEKGDIDKTIIKVIDWGKHEK